VQRRDKRLRETVAKTSGCLDDLSSAERRVLTLRAGVGAGRPQSRRGVARRLDISVRRVARLEKAGLRHLRRLGARGGCAPASTTVVSGATAPTSAVAAVEPRDRDDGESGGQGGGDERADSGGGGGDDRGGTGTPEDEGPPPGSGGVAGVSGTNQPGAADGFSLILPLGALALLLAALAVLLLRRRSEPEPAVVAAAEPDPEPEPERPVWKPWRESSMDGPGWTAEPPPSREGSWADSPAKEPEPPPAPSPDSWAAQPPSGRPARR
jgi:hypothetical protein